MAAFFQNIKKIAGALRVNGTKVNSRNTFIENIFALESEKGSTNDEKAFFGDYP